MSTLGFPARTGSEAPDTLARRIDAAIAAVPLGKRGTFLAAADLNRTAIAVMIRAGDNVSFLGRVTKPWRGPLEAEALVRVNFAGALSEGATLRLDVWDYYEALRAPREGLKRNSKFRALVKAFFFELRGSQPYLDGSKWFRV